MPRCSLAADIGADHGYTTLSLLQNGIADHVLCTDISAPSLDKARRAVRAAGLEKSVTFLTGDGLTVLAGHFPQAVVLAGMGGETIASILSEKRDWFSACTFVLQPMTRADVLRARLYENGFLVSEERLAEDAGHIYPILQVRYDGKPRFLDEITRLVGFSHPGRTDDLTRRYFLHLCEQKRKKYEGLLSAHRDKEARAEEKLLHTLLAMTPPPEDL